MGMLQTLISCLSTCHPEANPAYYGGQFSYKCQDERDTHIHRILGQAPSIAAACLRIHQGQDIIQPDISLGYAENFLAMTLGPDSRMTKNSKIVHALETVFILHAEHEMQCSTAAMRHMASSMADVYVSLSGALTSLYGPRHGGGLRAHVPLERLQGESIRGTRRRRHLSQRLGGRLPDGHVPAPGHPERLGDAPTFV